MSTPLIDEGAMLNLKELSAWAFTSIQMEMEMRNFFRCVDEDRHAKVRPFLSHLGLDRQIGYGYKICRVTGRVALQKSSDFQALLFPLSIGAGSRSIGSGEAMINVGLLKPGYWIEITTVIVIDALMDCLIVLLPEPGFLIAPTQSQSLQIEHTVSH
ncbi:hypothetical protein N7517_007705 [Penicillium concentricum]|uniref:Uncharacterized protein n=1 Tax=Penicillium concentricum TaxID=293559 RepID=A0A9W9VCJ5_9EURO|nr:uncharacterized protein N7517_007705 [Penicillium concentricum]KAJ5375699.1 hypothetical protein N7517_007705 [Penicillium concentricum]